MNIFTNLANIRVKKQKRLSLNRLYTIPQNETTVFIGPIAYSVTPPGDCWRST